MNQLTHSSTHNRATIPSWRRRVFAALAVLITAPMVAATIPANTQAAPFVGQGFTVTASDLSFILDQIKIAEHHSLTATAADPCAGLLGTGPDQVPSPLIALGLRTIDGSCNNLQPGQDQFGAADQVFPRLTTASFQAAETSPPAFGPPHPTSYQQTNGFVFDSEPRMISNLIVDQTSTNPAAVAAAGFPVRTQGNEGVVPCTTEPTSPNAGDGIPAGCVPAYQTLFIPNVTTDVGLSPPYNSLFTIFGQFFDHGLDKITNGGNGQVFVPLKDDDPLVAGPDHIFGTTDDLDPNLRFMVVTRGTMRPGPDGLQGTADDIHEAVNTDSPWVDLSQDYTSHSSHQVFLREYALDGAGHPMSTGKLLGNADGSMANWDDVKREAATKLGMLLVDTDVGNIPMIAADPYGNFKPGPNGLPQYVTTTGLVEGNLLSPVAIPTNAFHIDTAFLNDIAHSAAPAGSPDPDGVAGTSLSPAICANGFPSGVDPDGAGAAVALTCYDDELLGLHVIAGDGRVNENIGLTTIHTIFEHEHNRLRADEQNTLDANPSLKSAYEATNCAFGCATNNPSLPTTFTYGQRMFQAARFVTEMEYQHLVFEEFARKVQPAINPFNLFAFSSTATNPAVKAEFAHAVYRFGHSMLDETIPRRDIDALGVASINNDIPLLDGFLNPAAFKDVTAGDMAAAGGDMGKAGAGAIVMGLSDQVGNELDEFVTNQLRNNLLGLPLDLPAINMTRARSEGIPSLNNLRKEIFAQNGDGQLTPYTDWVDFGLHLKHGESLINFVAAYGHHPTILFAGPGPDLDYATTADNAPATLQSRRDAARAIVAPELGDVQPADAADFMFSTGDWTNTGDVSNTGVDDIDLWVGGLAEITNLFGGLLGTTFNYVFELQLTQLQDDDRLYYLNRTPGMNLRAQLEGNSFAELVMRNTTATSLKADAFGTADCKFQLGDITGPASAGTNIAGKPNITGAGSLNDVPSSECDENALLIKATSGQIRYRPVNTVDPSGINGQSVYTGTDNVDRVAGGNDNDTFIGGLGNDVIEGNGGDDVALGGLGNDIITDLAGFDTLKGGPGNDALDGGISDDLLLGGDGKDLTVGGANTNVHFDGPGDDFIIAGQGADEVDGDSGDDFMEGGEQTDLLQGDSGTLFFDDHNLPGNDVMIGQAGDDDYDMEGGDDIGVAGPGIEKNAGAAGYDWSIGLADPQPQDADLALPVIGVPLPINQVRDRFNEVEALSGWDHNDILRGDDVIPSQITGGGFIGCDALDQNGLDRIAGLDDIVPPLSGDAATDIVPGAATKFCPLVGPYWGAGNILLGGGGSDLIEGRAGDDIIDGDRYLNVRLSVRAGVDVNGNATGGEIGSTDLLEHTALTGNFGAGTAGKTLQQSVFAGLVDAGQIVVVREILSSTVPVDPAPSALDTALFSGPSGNYAIVATGPNELTITDGIGTDGIDIVRNVEFLQFTDIQVAVSTFFNNPATGTVTISSLTPVEGVTLTAVAAVSDLDGISGPVTITWQQEVDPGTWTPVADGDTFTPEQPNVGAALRVIATFVDDLGNQEQVNGDVTAPVLNVNQPVQGSPVILGTLRIGDPQFADVSGISDVDGLPLGFNFQWSLNGTDVVGATAQTFTPTPGTVGQLLRVRVSYTDLQGTPESTLSAPETILPPPAPIATPSAASLTFGTRSTISGVSTQVITITNTGNAPLNIGAVTRSGTNQARFAVGTGCTNVVVAPSLDCQITVAFTPTTLGANTAQISIANNAGPAIVIPFSATVVTNAAPTGTSTVSDTTPTVGQTLTATTGTIADADGLVGVVFNFQWQERIAGVNTNIAGETNPTFTPTATQLNRQLRVVVTFVDNHFTNQTVNGALTTVVGDNFVGTAGNDTWTGNAGEDIAVGRAGNDTLTAAAGNDIVAGDGGDDVINTGGNDDVIEFSGALEGFDNVNGGANVDTVRALSAGTIIGLSAIAGVETVTANGNANVSISGSPANNTLNFSAVTLTGITLIDGNAGNDNITGSAVADRIRGGNGNDTMNGGTGDDTFVYNAATFGADVINGFDSDPAGGQDKLDISAFGLTPANFGINVVITQVGANVRVTFGGGTITLNAQVVANVTIDDFILA